MFDITQLVRPNVQALRPYKSARDEFEGLAEIALDANENPFGFGLNRYPDTAQTELKHLFASLRACNPEQLVFGNGSDELIDLLIRAFCEPQQDKIMTFTPTFGMYDVCAKINAVENIAIPLTPDFQIDITQAHPHLEDDRLKLIFVCSPNNPTGNQMDIHTIQALARDFKGLVIVDEAYIDFADQSLVSPELENIFILQTFSKAFGLAGIRLGVGIGHKAVVNVLHKVKAPYNVNSVTQEKALEALRRPAEIQKQAKMLVAEREKLEKILPTIPSVTNVFPSDANFLLVAFENAKATYEQLSKKGIVVRDRSSQVANTLRLTVGTPQENEQLVAALKNEDVATKGRIGKSLRVTSETQILVEVNLDDPSNTAISTGISFFDHMLDQIGRHGAIGLHVQVKGDVHIDTHHTIEDTALALGAAFNEALSARKGIERYGFLLPMDDCLAQVAIDFGGRPWLEWDVSFRATHIGEFPTEMASHFFKSFSDTSRSNLNIKAEGENDHHKIESIFKAFARALKMAVRKDESGILPSTKGVL